MDFILHSTLVTATGLLVIVSWLLIGYGITRLWCFLTENKIRFTWKIILGVFGGPITIIGMLIVGFLNLIPDNLFD